MREAERRRLSVFDVGCLRASERVTKLHLIKNVEIRKKARVEQTLT